MSDRASIPQRGTADGWLTAAEPIRGAAELRQRLLGELRSGVARWLRLDGVGVESIEVHSALLHALQPFGLCGEFAGTPPHTAVLDWSSCSKCDAEGLAFFVVLARELAGRGARIIVCGPTERGLVELLEESGFRASCACEKWILSEHDGRCDTRILGRGAMFGGELSRAGISEFLSQLDSSLNAFGLPDQQAAIASALVCEAFQNVLSHANASHAAAVAVRHSRRRPSVIQVGIADTGVGIPAHVLSHPRHAWLASFSDASVTEVVLDQSISGRPNDEGGGGFGLLARTFLRECDARLLVRSGAALVTLSSDDPNRYRKRMLTYGAGTQMRFELRLPRQ